MTRPIALIGLPGSGKSTVGGLLASRLSRSCCDVDRLIEQLSGWSASRWIDEKGLPAFRAAEALFMAVLEDQPSSEDSSRTLVVSTGGGVVEIPSIREILGHWRCVWLDGTDSELLLRCDPGTRPLLAADGEDEAMAALRSRREPYYRKLAGEPIDTTGISPSAVVDVILSRLEEDREC